MEMSLQSKKWSPHWQLNAQSWEQSAWVLSSVNSRLFGQSGHPEVR